MRAGLFYLFPGLPRRCPDKIETPKQKQNVVNVTKLCCCEASQACERGRHNSNSGVINRGHCEHAALQRHSYRCARCRSDRTAQINGLQTGLVGMQLQISQFCADVVCMQPLLGACRAQALRHQSCDACTERGPLRRNHGTHSRRTQDNECQSARVKLVGQFIGAACEQVADD